MTDGGLARLYSKVLVEENRNISGPFRRRPMKNLTKLLASASCAAILMIGLSPSLRADPWNKKTIITINEPMQVPTKVLEPGKYVFKLIDSNYRHVVQVFNEDETRILTTIIAIPNERLHPTDKSEFKFWESPAGQPHALRAWFYPGDNFGHEFAYSPTMAAQITAYNKTSVPVMDTESKDLTTAKIEQSKVEAAPEIARDTTPTPTPIEAAPVAPVDSTPAPVETASVAAAPDRVQADRPSESTPTELPRTASYYPTIALVGLLSLCIYGLLTRSKSTNQ
jgi:hypothetical protein